MNILVGILISIHGLSHLLYFGHSARLFELQAGMTWPENSWALRRIIGADAIRAIAAAACIMAAAGFILGGIALFASFGWWRTVIVGTAIFSTILYLVLWDGKMQGLDNSGLIAVFINLGILMSLLFLRWPRFDF